MNQFDLPLIELSVEEMKKNVVRLQDLKPIKTAFVDTVIPGYEREAFSVIGTTVVEAAGAEPPIRALGEFNVGYVRSKPGARGALHSHPTVEVFIPLTGRWSFIW